MNPGLQIPDYVESVIQPIRQAGFPVYAVGGCVRDSLLGLRPHDYDLCTGALPDQVAAIFPDHDLVTAGQKHGTTGVVTFQGIVEVTTFRREGTYSDGRHPDSVTFVSGLREDLARRDFTVNAMAWAPDSGLQDPFGGREDLQNRVLRAVGDPETRFREDGLRILRGVRFALRFGLTPEAETLRAMLSCAPLLDRVSQERIYAEMNGILPLLTVGSMALYAPILTRVIPELEPMVGFDQHSPHHAYDLYTHTAHVVEAVPGNDLCLRWAALLHDVGKTATFTRDETGRGHFYGHASAGAEMADRILRRLTMPGGLREQTVLLIAQHMTRLTPDRKSVRRAVHRFGRLGVEQILTLQQADMGSKGTGENQGDTTFARIREILSRLDQEAALPTLRDLAVNGRDLLALGLTGPAIGQTLDRLLEQVVEESLPNDREALLTAAKVWNSKL